MEIIATLVYKLLKDATPDELEAANLGSQYVQNGNSPFWTDANGVPWVAAYIGATGDPIADLTNNMAAEQKARATYEHLIRLTDDAGVRDALCFLREREVVHFQRFGETLTSMQEYLNSKRFY